MCRRLRLTLNRDGEKITKFACVDGPDFNGYEVDFDEAMSAGQCTAILSGMRMKKPATCSTRR